MLYEINQIKAFLAKKFNLPYENGRVVGQVPDGDYEIPLGVKLTPYKVTLKNDTIHIGEKVEAGQ